MRLKTLGYFKEGHWGHRTILAKLKIEGPTTYDNIQSRTIFDKAFSIRIPSRKEWSSNAVIAPDNLDVYTDGSKTSEGTGSGLFCLELDINLSLTLPNECTVFQAEMLAINIAATSLLTANIANRTVSIFVDSQAAIKALNSTTIRSSLVMVTRANLNTLGLTNCVTVCWVPGHENYEGNEQVHSVKPHERAFLKQCSSLLSKLLCF